MWKMPIGYGCTFDELKVFWTTLFILRVVLVPVFGMQKMLYLYSFVFSLVLLTSTDLLQKSV